MASLLPSMPPLPPRSRAGFWWRLLGLDELYEPPLTAAAQERALALFKAQLTPQERRQYERHDHFDVIGGQSGRRYRIRYGTQMNVQVLDGSGRCMLSLCFTPRGRLPVGDVLLAQKIALQLFEYEALNVANGRGLLPMQDETGGAGRD